MRSRYENSQRILWNMNSACFFITLLSIAEEERARLKLSPVKIDLLDSARYSMNKKWIDSEYFVRKDVKILEWLTGKKVVKSELDKVGVLADNVYSVEKWEYNGGNHFRRRYFDVYDGSLTVEKGNLVSYYVYTFI